MTFNQTSSIRFSVEESVWFKKGQEVAQVLSMSLDPEISIQEHENYISIRGALVLTGDYYPNNSNQGVRQQNDQEIYSLRETATLRTVDEIRENETGVHSMKHRFPVDITIPTNRIRSLEDVYILIESFDYEIPDNGRLELKADLAISGIVNEKAKSNSLSVAEEVNNRIDNKVESISQVQANKDSVNKVEPISAVRGTEASDSEKVTPVQQVQPAVMSTALLKAVNEQKVQPILRDSQENATVTEAVGEEKFPSFTTEVRKEAGPIDNVEDLQEAVNIDSGDSGIQLDGAELFEVERNEEQAAELVEQAEAQEDIPVVISAKIDSPQIGMKGRSEQQGYAWNPKGLYSSHGTFSSSAVPDQIANGQATSEKPVKSIIRSENALYLTKMLSTDGAQDFSKLRVRIVQQGESLGTIAASYEISANQIMRVNGLVDDVLEEGQILYIPEYAGVQ